LRGAITRIFPLGWGGARVRDALVDALMGPSGVVVLLVFGQDGPQVCRVQDQGPVE
jgi:hypothetical protein